MSLLPLDPSQARAAMRAVKEVICVNGTMREVQRRALGLGQRYILHTDEDIDALAPITPDELARALVEPALRRQVIQVMCAYVMLGKDIEPAHLDAIRRYAGALGVDEPTVNQLRYAMEERLTLLRFDFRRRTAIGGALRDAYEERGLRGLVSTAMEIAGHGHDPALARRFHALEALPDGSLGKDLWRFYHEQQFVFPGDPHGTPLALLTHDLVHIVSGYPANPPGEVLTLAFQTGFKRESPLTFMILILFQAQMGIEMVSLAKDVAYSTGYFDQPGVIEEVFRAYSRGAAMKFDLFDHWDYWAVFDRPVEELRTRYGVPPA